MTRSPIACLDAEVLRVRDLSPSFRRVTLGGPGIDRFGITGPPLDLRVKLVIPPEGVPERFDLPAFMQEQYEQGTSWYQAWLLMEPSERGAMRTYTVRAWRPDVREMDIDMVLHVEADGTAGPAASWAMTVRPGDHVHVIAPDRDGPADYGGIEFAPAGAEEVLLAGDETAVPAIASILEALPENVRGRALLEVPSSQDEITLTAPAGMEITWLGRDSRPHGELLGEAVRETVLPPLCGVGDEVELEEIDLDRDILWETPARISAAAVASAPASEDTEGAASDAATTIATGVATATRPARRPRGATGAPFYAWIAGEASLVRGLRRYLVREVGVDRRQVAFMGYWRAGRAEG